MAAQNLPRIQGSILTPLSDGFELANDRNSLLSILKPAYIFQPNAYSDIPPILHFASSHSPKLEVVVKCGGCHSSTWASTDQGIVIDLSQLTGVRLSEDKQTVVVQGGANWGHVYEVASKANVDVVGAPWWFVGVGGSLVGGAQGHITPQYGQGIDNMVGATVVLADGRIVTTSETEEPDLFWAIRGGGNQFGIVVEFVLTTHPCPGPATVGLLAYHENAFPEVLRVVQEYSKANAVLEKVVMMFTRFPPAFKPTVVVLPWISAANSRSSDDFLQPFRALPAPPFLDKVGPADALQASHATDATRETAPRRLNIRGGACAELSTELVTSVWDRWVKFTEETLDARATAIIFDGHQMGNAAKVGREETAYALRDPFFSVAIQGRNTQPSTDAATAAFVKEIADYIHHQNRALGIQLNMARGDERAEDVFGVNLPRLRKLKAKYDPKGVWAKGFRIEPDFSET